MLFVGNCLQSTMEAEKHPERADHTFHFTPQEAKDLDLRGLPVRFEHDEGIGKTNEAGSAERRVGTVLHNWQDQQGTVWCVGSLDGDSIGGRFAQNAVRDQKTHLGLSLQHVHEQQLGAPAGTGRKYGVEVSICKSPRRSGCRVVATGLPSAQYKYTRGTCVTRQLASMSENANASTKLDSAQPTPDANPAPAAPAAASAPQEQQKPPSDDENTQQRLMQQVVDLAAALEKSEQKSIDSQKALEAAEEREKQREAKLNDERSRAVKSMTDAVLQTVARTDPELSKLPVGCAVERLMESRPEDVEQIMRIAHCCSKAAQEAQKKLEEQQKQHENNQLEQQYQNAIARVTPGGVTTHAASRKRQRFDGPGASSVPSGASAMLPSSRSSHASNNPYSSCTNFDTSDVTAAYNSLRHGKTGNAACDQIAGILRKNAAFGHA